MMDDDSPSFGETRAADVPTTVVGNRGRSTPVRPSGVASQPFFERTVDMPRYASPPSRPTRGSATGNTGMTGMPGTQGGSSRYCGTCGARIERGEVFCGQCGTPVGTSSTAAPSRYVVGDDEMWSPAQGDALTEAYVPSPPTPFPAPYNRGMASTPYNQGYGTPAPQGGYGAQAPTAAARANRIMWGVVCLAASLITAGATLLIHILWH